MLAMERKACWSNESRMSWVTLSSEGSISGRRTISPRVKSASLRFAATRSRSDRAAMPANWSPDFSSLALANSSRRSEKANRSIMNVPGWRHSCYRKSRERRATVCWFWKRGLAPGALLTVGRGNYRGCGVRFAGVIVDCGRSLSAEVAALRVEVQRADAVCALRAGELHAALDALDSIGFHWLNCSPSGRGSQDALVGQLR